MSEEPSIQATKTAYSDVGTLRKANEDSYYISENENLLIVCDGMGGQVAGGLASKIAVETIKDIYFGLPDDQLSRLFPEIDRGLPQSARLLIAAVRTANRRLYNMALKFPKLRGMGTTVVALSFDQDAATLVHVGDSRVFRISDNAITQLTEDHSWLNELIEDNEINEEQIETFAQKNVITRALGTAPTIKIDLHCEKYKKDDIYILCSDGLHNALTQEEIKETFNKQNSSLEVTIKQLIEKAKSTDGSDNITAAAAQVDRDCDNSSQVGISTTIPPEDAKNAAKTDKFIQEKYGEAKVNLFGKPQSKRSLRPYITAGLGLLISALVFILVMNLQSKKGFSSSRGEGTLNSQTSLSGAAPQNNTAEKTERQSAMEVKAGLKSDGRTPGAGIGKDAVMAVVLFNSVEDYRRSKLEQNAKVLDKFQPYADASKNWSRNNFTFFLIDSANNVIRKRSGLEIPAFSDGK